MKPLLCFLICTVVACLEQARAERFTFGAYAGVEFPFVHESRTELGPRVDAFYRLDPYEVRFHFAELNEDFFWVGFGRKFFFAQQEMRPFFELAGGIAFVDTTTTLAYGISPEFSLGVELAINRYLSTTLASRYTVYWYFGDLPGSDMEVQHALSVVAGLNLWF